MGIGGAYLCVYGMEGPGGYQFVGRTLQMWNRWRDAGSAPRPSEPGKPWLLRFFDQIRFYPVGEAELLQIRRDFPVGRHALRIEPGRFGLRDYRRFLDAEAVEIEAFRQRQRAAFDEERERWRLAGQAEDFAEPEAATAARRRHRIARGRPPGLDSGARECVEAASGRGRRGRRGRHPWSSSSR